MSSLVNIIPVARSCWLGIYILTLLLMSSMVECDEDTSYRNTTVPSEENLSSSIEEKVLGPLRIWHIVFIVTFFLLIAMVAAFCCVEIRVPRSRQEIEDNYQKRLLNLKYVRMLEKAPEELLRTEFPKPEVAVTTSSKETKPRTGRQQQASAAAKGWQQAKTGAMSSKASSNRDVDATSGGQGLSMIGSRMAKVAGGGPQPLAINPRDILSIMAQQRKTKTDD